MGKFQNYRGNRTKMQRVGRLAGFRITWLVVGLALGTMMSLLYAPAKGKKTRHALTKNIEEGLNSGQETAELMINRLEKEVSELRKTIEKHVDKLT